ncbi:hypothetical protein C7W88_12870 [Novosphingobium sp. THN1]|uniref:hypothetical protein n=1 Tax=Novosphingobium sp. THN1 TaxID=1016987 RepID=UPI000E507B81|nr:hypothetical protein [Novosphingobium sp. THN1]AXU19714.1 hypothetical protein C7W88_12870 [Novosphingobium sp. THN1]
MINLRSMANRLTSGVNPNVTATLLVSTGYATDAAGLQVPTYAAPETVTVQVQALTQKELQHLDKLNITNGQAGVFVDRQLNSADRSTGSGGDVFQFPDSPSIPADLRGSEWLVVAVLEGWPGSGWCRAAITRQMS